MTDSRATAIVGADGTDLLLFTWVTSIDVGEAETATFRCAFLRSLVERGLSGAQLVVSDGYGRPNEPREKPSARGTARISEAPNSSSGPRASAYLV